jgi:hypothetical protein
MGFGIQTYLWVQEEAVVGVTAEHPQAEEEVMVLLGVVEVVEETAEAPLELQAMVVMVDQDLLQYLIGKMKF